MKFIDIAVNLGDPMFRGQYHGKRKHEDDLAAVVQRAHDNGVERMLLTGTSLEESKLVLDLAKKFDSYTTAGCHPTSTSEIDKYPGGADKYFADLEAFIESDLGPDGSKRIVSLGEIGLDYDRLKFSDKETQLKHLPPLLQLSKKYSLPMFLHDRHPEAHADLVRLLKEAGFDSTWPGGVVHSFTGTVDEMQQLLDMGLYIGVNGCSMKTEENLQVVKAIPLDRLMLETDAPWCSITTTHASHKYVPKTLPVEKVKPEKFQEGKGAKGRQEPSDVVIVASVVAGVKGESVETVAQAAFDNSMKVFWPGRRA